LGLALVRLKGKTKWSLIILLATLSVQVIPSVLCEPAWKTQLVDPYGAAGSLAVDSKGTPHIAYTTAFISNDSSASGGLQYAVLIGKNWTTNTVDPNGSDPSLALDSQDQPHIAYDGAGGLKYASLNADSWSMQTIDTSEKGYGSELALDSNANPHVVYFAYNTVQNGENRNVTAALRYAVFNGHGWNIQTVDTLPYSGPTLPLSIALDSNDYPHILYTYQADYPFSQSYLFNVKYAAWNGSSWLVQSAVNDSSEIGNLVLNSNGQPSFCSAQNGITTYAYWNGQAWVFQAISSKDFQYGPTYLRLDSNNNPQVFFYTENNSEPSITVKFATLASSIIGGSSWNVMSLGSFPLNSAYYQYTEGMSDFTFDAKGNPSLITFGEVGTIRGAAIWGGLTYASSPNNFSPKSSSQNLEIFALFFIIIGIIAVAVAILLIHWLRSKAIRSNHLK
jgi:hypothetical protein